MRIKINENSVSIWLCAQETTNWANGSIWAGSKRGWIHGGQWPCSELRGRRLFAAFDRNGLCDLAVDGRSDAICGGDEFSTLCADYLALRLPREHPCYEIAVGQFKSA